MKEFFENNFFVKYLHDMTVLCVENDEFSQKLYAMLLEDVVSEVLLAKDLDQGSSYFANRKIDLIITDYQMPHGDGLELIRQIRAKNHSIPIILVTAIDSPEIIIKALNMNVSYFVRKPIDTYELFDTVLQAAKIVIAEQYMETQRNEKIKVLEEKEKYIEYQQRLAFDKELSIIRNDYYYQIMECEDCKRSPFVIIPDFIYRPLDTLSGDAYTARKIDAHKTFFLLVDGMGKGVSASLTAMLMTAHVNYLVDKMISENFFDLTSLISDAMDYIRPILLDDEIVSIDFIVLDQLEEMMLYAKFAMPRTLLQDKKEKIISLKSNNPPMNRYYMQFVIDYFDISDIKKFLFCTDGLVENTLLNGKSTYESYITEDFAKSFTKEEFKECFLQRIGTQEDDITLIYINRFVYEDGVSFFRSFSTSMNALEEANDWYETIWKGIVCENQKLIDNAQIVFTELMMNAYEHGNLGVGSVKKDQLIKQGCYYETLMEYEKECNKRIDVSVHIHKYGLIRYILTRIRDEGNGFDTQILSKIFRNKASFNGKGVYVSRQSSLGIYYNKMGNSVFFIHKVM